MNEKQALKLPPGMIVTLSTKVTPPPIYEKVEIREPEEQPDGSEVAEWQTKKTVQDREEFDEATSVRLKVRSLVGAVAIRTSFGLLCPKADLPKLDAALAEARKVTDAFNAESSTYKVKWASLRGEIAENTAEAVAAIKQEVSGLIAEADAAMEKGDVKKLRGLASQAAGLGPLLGDANAEGRTVLDKAIKAYRRVARAVVKRVSDQGEDLATVLHEANLAPVAQARFLFEADPEAVETDEEVGPEVLGAGEEDAEEVPELNEPGTPAEDADPEPPIESEDGMQVHDQGVGWEGAEEPEASELVEAERFGKLEFGSGDDEDLA